MFSWLPLLKVEILWFHFSYLPPLGEVLCFHNCLNLRSSLFVKKWPVNSVDEHISIKAQECDSIFRRRNWFSWNILYIKQVCKANLSFCYPRSMANIIIWIATLGKDLVLLICVLSAAGINKYPLFGLLTRQAGKKCVFWD